MDTKTNTILDFNSTWINFSDLWRAILRLRKTERFAYEIFSTIAIKEVYQIFHQKTGYILAMILYS